MKDVRVGATDLLTACADHIRALAQLEIELPTLKIKSGELSTIVGLLDRMIQNLNFQAKAAIAQRDRLQKILTSIED